jgi:hypothetical protein
MNMDTSTHCTFPLSHTNAGLIVNGYWILPRCTLLLHTLAAHSCHTLQTCLGDCHARFLLAWEDGVMLGDDGWSTDYEKVRSCHCMLLIIGYCSLYHCMLLIIGHSLLTKICSCVFFVLLHASYSAAYRRPTRPRRVQCRKQNADPCVREQDQGRIHLLRHDDRRGQWRNLLGWCLPSTRPTATHATANAADAADATATANTANFAVPKQRATRHKLWR